MIYAFVQMFDKSVIRLLELKYNDSDKNKDKDKDTKKRTNV